MNTRSLSRIGAIGVVTMTLGLGACSDDEANLFQTLQADARYTTLVTALEAAGLDDDLTGSGILLTVFAPTNAAFEALPEGVLDAVLADPDLLEDVLLYHVAAGRTMSTDLSDGQAIPTQQGSALTVSISGSTVEINDATVTQADLEASNGVIHVTDGVLVPATASFSERAAGIERRRQTPREQSTTRLGAGDQTQNQAR